MRKVSDTVHQAAVILADDEEAHTTESTKSMIFLDEYLSKNGIIDDILKKFREVSEEAEKLKEELVVDLGVRKIVGFP
ncbi:hypothetical protein CHS0354_008654 [Potamilus streckersoni]|uniref:Uncharacterized protein n=1 Tax=Potamilus streckersoni TaxID=2493646 RepID=A0AAE0THE3_9BIVA|nr:hypothetical protein CHS0354_008654 [Potamilus streckersoni]